VTASSGPLTPPVASRTSLREQIGVSLRAALVAGEMVPGVTYSAPVLAERFGVSATPVREAMLDLINEGMIVAVPNRGFRIVETTDQDLDEMTELRRLIEVPTVGQIAKSITSEQVDGLRLIATRIMDAAAKGDVVTYIEADRQFHLELLRLSGNTRLVDLVDQLRMNTRLYGLEELAASGHLGRSSEEHLTLLDALEAGDRRGAERVMAQHLGHVRGIWANRHEQPSAVDE
jgi:DNA-binding GntR family transcriptional regulator